MGKHDRAYIVRLPLYIHIRDAALLAPAELKSRLDYFTTQAVRKIDAIVNDGGELNPDDQPSSLEFEETDLGG